MLMFSAFKTLTGQTVVVELKNDLAIQGTLKSVDQYWTPDVTPTCAVRSTFIRGSVVRYVYIPAAAVDTQLLEDATRREAETQQRR
ncbi:LSM2 [Malassezia furfur]|nr:LSM2 [Malassezia furfur]